MDVLKSLDNISELIKNQGLDQLTEKAQNAEKKVTEAVSAYKAKSAEVNRNGQKYYDAKHVGDQ